MKPAEVRTRSASAPSAFVERTMPYQSRNGSCSFPGCSHPILAKGLCAAHYQQQLRGVPLFAINSTRRRNGSPPRTEFVEQPCSEWGLSKGLTTPCRIFVGPRDRGGYGSVTIGHTSIGAHLYVWERDVGPVPDDLEIDHVCRVRPCINTDHMRTVTHQVNVTENVVGSFWMLNAAKTHCIKGHAFTLANTRLRKAGGRACRECQRLAQAEYRLRQKGIAS